MNNEFDDTEDQGVSDAILMGLESVDDATSIEVIDALADGTMDMSDALEAEGNAERAADESGESAAPDEIEIPAYRVAEVMRKIGEFAERAGMDVPEFGDPVSMPKRDFDALVAQRERVKTLASVRELDAAEPAIRQAVAPQANAEPQPDRMAEFVDAYNAAFFNGDEEGMRVAMGNMQKAIREEAVKDAMEHIRHDREREDMQASYRKAADQAVADYPDLGDKDSKAFRVVSALIQTNVQSGMSPAQALETAVNDWAESAGRMPYQRVKSDQKQDARSAGLLGRTGETMRRQPPAMDAGIGGRAIPERSDYSQEEWNAMSERERERLLLGA